MAGPGILTGYEPHQTFINVLTDQTTHACLVWDIQSLALACNIGILVVADG